MAWRNHFLNEKYRSLWKDEGVGGRSNQGSSTIVIGGALCLVQGLLFLTLPLGLAQPVAGWLPALCG